MPDKPNQNGSGRDKIESRAYELYVKRGAMHGYDVDDWLAAEQEFSQSIADGDGLDSSLTELGQNGTAELTQDANGTPESQTPRASDKRPTRKAARRQSA
jgi:hypothetical protein